MLVRTFLAVSISSLIFTSAFAENNASQLNQIPDTSAIQIENRSLSQSSTEAVTQTTQAVSNATSAVIEEANTVNDVINQEVSTTQTTVETDITTETQNTSVAPSNNTTTQNTAITEPAAKVEWTLDALNNAEWSENLERGQFPVYAKAQVLLNRNYVSPGAIDGATGMNTLKAISAYQTIKRLSGAGVLTQETWNSLVNSSSEPAFVHYTITAEDLKTPMVKSIPASAEEKAKLKGLYYTRHSEMFGEKFHMDENFLKKLNPNANFSKVGEKIIVANIRNTLPEDIKLIIAHKSAKQLYLFNSKNQMIAAFPATVGKEGTPSPKGDLKISNIAPNPWYSYNPKTFGLPAGKTYSVAPGPNNYVGNMWIGLSRPSFGIHGTPEPSNISKGTGSNGCVRLTNWDANNLAKFVKVGTVVKFLE